MSANTPASANPFTALTREQAETLWRALWSEMDSLEAHEDNAKYLTGREAIFSKQRGASEMLKSLRDAHNIVREGTLSEMLCQYSGTC